MVIARKSWLIIGSDVSPIGGLTVGDAVVLDIVYFLVWHFLKKRNIDNNLEAGNKKLIDYNKEWKWNKQR